MEGTGGYFVATVEPPSAVFHSLYARFMGPNVHNLIISKTNRLEVYEIGANGLVAKLEVPINGRITGASCDTVFVCTEKERYCLLRYDGPSATVQTVESGGLHDRACRPIEQGQMAAIDPTGQMIALHLVQGLVKLIPVDARAKFREPINRRIDELQVVGMSMLQDSLEPVLAILHETVSGGFSVRTYRVNLKGKEFEAGPWSFDDLDFGSRILISVPLPRGGVLIDNDGFRYLLADSEGGMYVLILFGPNNRVESLKLEYLGATVIAAALTYLDNGFVYVGSHFGDSQIVRLSSSRLADGNFIEIADVLPGTGPIVDFVTVDIEKIGQSSIMACAGAFKQGVLQCIRRGANLTANSIAEAELPIVGMFSVLGTEATKSTLFLSTPSCTRILKYTAQEGFEEVDHYGRLITKEASLLITQIGDAVVQVTAGSITFSVNPSLPNISWVPPRDALITTASVAGNGLIVGTSDKAFQWFDCSQKETRKSRQTFSDEISSIGLGLINEKYFAVVAFWNSESVKVVDFDSKEVTSIPIPTAGVIQSIQVAQLEESSWVFLGHGNGSVSYCKVEITNGRLVFHPFHRAGLGTGPVDLIKTRLMDREILVALIDRPFIITSVRDRIVFNLSNAKNVDGVVGLAGTTELVIARDNELVLCSLDDTKSRLHHISYPIKETSTRLIHVPSAKAYVILHANHRPTSREAGEPPIKSRISILDRDLFNVLDCYELPDGERAHSITTTYLVAQNTDAIIVGTAIVQGPGQEPQNGRILTFVIDAGQKFSLISQTAVPGCVYAMGMSGVKLVASINGMTSLYRWTHAEGDFFSWRNLHTHFGQILGVRMDVRGNHIAVGDLMKSVNLLRVEGDGDLVEVARDYESNWMTEVCFISDTSILGADNLGNVFVFDATQDASFSSEKLSLTMTSGFHLGEIVNKIHPGTLARQGSGVSNILTDPHLMSTACGSVYFFARLSQSNYQTLRLLENNMATITRAIGNLPHHEWRALATERRKPRQLSCFVDGDLIAKYLELSPESRKLAVEGGQGCEVIPNMTVRQVQDLVELLLAAYQ
ncbi:DDB1-1 protein [Paramicrosporidium saccamoebae]|uniref:DDB1-1 protein n=1 Tax=Paramicrosporidium saccamoebae TaxID=1246581 RepID=A0A2H9TNX2_9FUNG|nr:DDB1-1 protein [Paramicrosporidium saccamoebae]